MNRQECDVLAALSAGPYAGQRELAGRTGHSVGVVNRSLKTLTEEGWLGEGFGLTEKARELVEQRRPRRAVILAAGFGMRMVPINLETPKALLEVKGELLIERLIRQLHEVGVAEITVVVGFMKEKFEYLIDEFGVDLIVNPDYAVKNNLHTLLLAADRLENAYVIPSDLWCRVNPFRACELYSWYLMADCADPDSGVRINRRMELVPVGEDAAGERMLGIAYLLPDQARALCARMRAMAREARNNEAFWEAALYGAGSLLLPARVLNAEDAVEINTYEQLRELDSGSNQLHSEVLDEIARVFGCGVEEIRDIEVLKKGMTNRSFLFSCLGGTYIMRIPGEGTEKLIDRRQEAAVYRAISGLGLCDDPVYIDPVKAYKITRFLPGVRTADPDSPEDLEKCMARLRSFHRMALKVDHSFELFDQIDFYESLWEGQPSAYRDYRKVKEGVLALRPYIEAHAEPRVLTHIDAVPDNFLFYRDESGQERLQLTDWEYAGMQDPHVDVAMFCIYSLYNRQQADRLIDIYFEQACPPETRIKIYCYIAVCGLLWSNWCEYKARLGVEFGEYSLRQYRYAKDFARYARQEREALYGARD